MSYKRPLYTTLLANISHPIPVMHVIIGPRQVGKTTIARQIEASIAMPAVYATADSPVPLDAAWIETQWRRALAQAQASGEPVLLILDELQKVRGWSETLKLLWDRRAAGPDIRVLILGSSALLMQEGLTESLAGIFFFIAAAIGTIRSARQPLAGVWSNGCFLAVIREPRCSSTMRKTGNGTSSMP